ncbi:hypothetical protein JDV02_010655 [Purpureocillium takamizusanense]|uniref:Uncharacterized protein n=1 Tax=Purpureocillium takamizusanense TaxID=2060973 RepID=A0A9Q8QS83_9HYPO|nr:uncharacterized protein JDV02_010655 [Purpureocillium takamizusanense]UNI24940.1 hypothetical protein JDV02_010655 [Purpureocillium takamizusanense]
MKTAAYIGSLLLLGARHVLANNAIPGSAFTNNNGLAAAEAAAPMWYMASGTCMPSAAEDGQGHQTNGVDPDNCNIGKLGHGCPPQPQWQGANTFYGNVAGEPFGTIPTYWKVARCGGNWKIIYYVYFKKDTGHKSDWEGIVVTFRSNGGDQWIRDSVTMEQDGHHKTIGWGDINDTFDSTNDWQNFQQKNRDHGKFYFGKWHHSVHQDWHTNTFKNTCPPTSNDDFRNADYQFWARNNLRPVSVLNPGWKWGKATSPANIDICSY